jgi:hypothetical protein
MVAVGAGGKWGLSGVQVAPIKAFGRILPGAPMSSQKVVCQHCDGIVGVPAHEGREIESDRKACLAMFE